MFSVIFLTSFFLNKNFHSHMSFDSDFIEYESTCERLQIVEVENISEHMNKTLTFACEILVKTWEQMMKQVNKYRKEINYEINSKIFLNERNIMTARSFKKLNNKMLNSFNMLDFVDFSYRLKLSETMHIRNVSHSELFHLVVNDLLPDQNNDSSESIIINDENEWKIDDILNF